MEALLGVIIGGVIGIFGTWYTTRETLREERRKNRQAYLGLCMASISEALAEYEEYLAESDNTNDDDSGYKDGNPVKHAKIIGKAIAACLAASDMPTPDDIPDDGFSWVEKNIPDVPYDTLQKVHRIHRLAYIANKRLTRNFVKEANNKEEYNKWGPYQDRNRNALDHASKRLALLIAETQKADASDDFR